MNALGLPDVRDENLLLRTADAAKEARHQQVAANYEIVMLVGDNLNDFSNVFEVSDPVVRMDKTDELKKLFSDKFIMLPNIMYGEWEPALYSPDSKTTLQKRADRYKALKTWNN